ncbi:MAG: isopeptide-forming domain-containing fimbrial protein [Eubacterium sp.]|nr:isopeptide-forming domain-containing fimbrial protein [Eubacterium sp.]
MKSLRKIMAFLIAMTMVLGMSISVFAAPATSQTLDKDNAADAEGKYTISVKSDDTHTYTVYQILTGTLIAGESKLGNPAWGSDAKTEGNVQDFMDSITVPGLSNAQIDDLVRAQLKTDAAGVGTVYKDHSLSVNPGYYLIKDTTATLAKGDAYSLDIVAVFNDITITPKKGTTTSEKKVDDKNDSNTSENAVEWKDSADYDIGDDVPFRLTATIADDYANYTKGYKLTFHDEQSAGLSFKANTVEVFVDGAKISDGYEVVTTGLTAPETFQIKFANLKKIAAVHAGSVITVTYNSTLTGDAVVFGKPGNPNESYVTYSNNPNDDQAGENGETKKDKVVVFTYKLDVDKIDGNNAALPGAGFTLYKKDSTNNQYVAVGAEVKGGQMTNFLWKGIDDGDYKLVESTTPAGYNTIDPIEFTVSATHTDGDDPDLTALDVTTGKGLAASLTAGTIKKKDNSDKTTVSGEVFGEIINTQGSTLPSTGGIGTTIFYVIGGILVAGAAIILIAKKRVNG